MGTKVHTWRSPPCGLIDVTRPITFPAERCAFVVSARTEAEVIEGMAEHRRHHDQVARAAIDGAAYMRESAERLREDWRECLDALDKACIEKVYADMAKGTQ